MTCLKAIDISAIKNSTVVGNPGESAASGEIWGQRRRGVRSGPFSHCTSNLAFTITAFQGTYFSIYLVLVYPQACVYLRKLHVY